jgi:hypothetical protein
VLDQLAFQSGDSGGIERSVVQQSVDRHSSVPLVWRRIAHKSSSAPPKRYAGHAPRGMLMGFTFVWAGGHYVKSLRAIGGQRGYNE